MSVLDQVFLVPGFGGGARQDNMLGWPSMPSNLRYTKIILQPRATVEMRSSAESSGTPAIQTSEVVHPSVVAFNQPWNGYKYWMLITPYPASNGVHENPTILASNDITDSNAWVEPNGIENPVHRRPSGVSPQGDVSWTYDPENDRLVMAWIRTQTSGDVRETLLSSFDGFAVTSPVVILTTLRVGSPGIVTYKSGGVRKWRLVYNVVQTPSFPDTLHWKELTGTEDLFSPTAWAAATQTDVSMTLPSSLGPWDFQCWRLQSGEYILLSSLRHSAGVCYTNHFGFSTDDLETVEWFQRPVYVPPITGWPGGPGGFAYTSSVVRTRSESVAVISGATSTVQWGQASCPLLEHPWRAMSSFPRDVVGGKVISHGQKFFEYTESGAGSFDTDDTNGLEVAAAKQFAGTIDGLASVPYTVAVEFNVPTDCSTVPNNTYVEICNVGGIRCGLKRHSNNVNWLIELRRADTNAAFWQPVYISGQPWLKIAFCRDGATFYVDQTPHGIAGTSGLTNLTHTQTSDIVIGSSSNAYGFYLRQIELWQDSGFQYTNNPAMSLIVADSYWPQSDLTAAIPQIWKHPASVSAGSGTSFSCYVGSYPGAALQWQVNSGSGWTDIGSATSNIYARNTTGEEGFQFRCVATNSSGTVISDSATVS